MGIFFLSNRELLKNFKLRLNQYDHVCILKGSPWLLRRELIRENTGGRELCEEVATVIKDRRDESLNLLSGGIKKSGLTKETESRINDICLWMDGLPWWLSGKEFTCNAGDAGDPWVRKIPWRKARLLTPVFLPGEFHGCRGLAGHSP